MQTVPAQKHLGQVGRNVGKKAHTATSHQGQAPLVGLAVGLGSGLKIQACAWIEAHL